MSIQGNIWKLYVIKMAKWFMLVMPIIALFIQDNGLSTFNIMLLHSIYSVAIVVMEIPSGYFADVWGRKTTLVIGSILGTIGYVAYSLSYDFTGFLIAELILGVALSFISGSDSAMLYDSLLASNKENDYIKVEGRITSVGSFAEMGAAIIGGLMAQYISLRAPFYAQIVIAFMAVPASLMLIEPPRDKFKKGSFVHILKIVKYALYENRKLKWQIIYSSVIGGGTLTMAWLLQLYLDNVLHLTKSNIGFTWAILNLIVGAVTWYAYKIELAAGKKKTIIFIAIFISLGYIMSGLMSSLWVFIFIGMFYFTRGIATPVLKNYINELTTSDMRATVLSMRTFLIRIFFSAVGPFIGWYSDLYSLQYAMIIAGSIILVGAIISIVFILKFDKKQ